MHSGTCRGHKINSKIPIKMHKRYKRYSTERCQHGVARVRSTAPTDPRMCSNGAASGSATQVKPYIVKDVC